ncbi:MAG TPA: hypothetical protein VK841_02895 [Polyangiaceae bacterium]|jgi:hypothetical protein|nr:hypothetical protein [Polyangiaceae bacterium]
MRFGLSLGVALAIVAGATHAASADPVADANASTDASTNGTDRAATDGKKDEKPAVIVWPTLTPAGDGASALPLHRPAPVADKDVFDRAQELDATLRDAVQDLGFTLAVADNGPAPGHTRDEDLIAQAASSIAGTEGDGTWIVSPRIESAGGGELTVRIVVVPPRGRELRVRIETVASESVSVRGLVMLRDLLSPTTAARAAIEQEREKTGRGSSLGIMSTLRSQGRAVLAVNAGLFGGYTAFSAQQASGSNDPRVLYPLLALGAGIGVGGALLVADEWDITTGDAWYLSGATWWGAAAAFLIAGDVEPVGDRYAWGVGGGLIGVTLATVALTRTTMDDGDAMLLNSGAAVGLLLGGATELLARGLTPAADVTPNIGMGYGTAIGLVAAGTLATRITISPSRVLLVDVGVGGGALLGAAIGSPLIFENATKPNTRGWLSTTIGGAVVGGALTWWLTRDAPPSAKAAIPGRPIGGIIGESQSPQGPVPAYGVGWAGSF